MNVYKISALLFLLVGMGLKLVVAQPLQQKHRFTRADSLRGYVTPERAWWDVTHYNIQVRFDFDNRRISGSNRISYKVLATPAKEMQIDLQVGLEIDSIVLDQQQLVYRRDGNAFFVSVPSGQDIGTINTIEIFYQGVPRPALRPPWDGGVIWSKDKNDNPWISVACQGLGASVWYPCKDHQGDEPDSASVSMIVPEQLQAVANGRFREKKDLGDGWSMYTWAVVNPINNYNIIPYIGKYVHWNEVFQGEKGALDCDYWVLDYNEAKARKQFQQVSTMLKCFENWFGPYPFYEDGYKLVESPHLGMEHQSAVAYGNGFINGYRGNDLSETGWGLKWDFIIVHESGHEWFGNNITTKDVADMWVHEGFTNYSETLFTDCQYGKEAGNDYVIGTRKRIQNDIPIQGNYDVNQEGSGDMYYKGGNMVHMIRQIINDDALFRQLLRGMNQNFYHQTVTGKQVEAYISKTSGINFSKLFDQYVRSTQIPSFEYKLSGKKLQYRWTNCIDGFDMPLKIKADTALWLKPTTGWKTLKLKSSPKNGIQVDRNFYVEVKLVN